jgi:hypothetical protein
MKQGQSIESAGRELQILEMESNFSMGRSGSTDRVGGTVVREQKHKRGKKGQRHSKVRSRWQNGTILSRKQRPVLGKIGRAVRL